MRVKFLEPALWLLISQVAAADIAPKVQNDRCYKTEAEFRLAAFEDKSLQDENIAVRQVGEGGLKLITDNTPAHNPERYLLRKLQGLECIVLIAPQAEEIRFSKGTRKGMPAEIVTTTGGQSSNDIKITYQLDPMTQNYNPVECALIWRNSLKRERISCQRPFDRFGAAP